MILDNWLLNFFLVLIVAGAALAASRQHRPFVFLLLLVQTRRALQSFQGSTLAASLEAIGLTSMTTSLTDVLIKTVILVTMHMGVLLFVDKYELPPRKTLRSRLLSIYKMVFNGRRIGTDRVVWQVCVPPIDPPPTRMRGGSKSATRSCEKKYAGAAHRSRLDPRHPNNRITCRENRAHFVVRRTALAALLLFFDNYLKPLVAGHVIAFALEDFSPKKQTFFRRLPDVSAHEAMVRCYVALDASWAAYAFYTAAHSLCSVFFVGIGLDEPHEWPPLFGDFRQAYSLRRYWVHFFDRLVYRTFSEVAKLLVGVLELALGPGLGRKGNKMKEPWRRWSVNGLIFLVSGLWHAQTNSWTGYKCGYWEEVRWWMMNYAAIVTEALVTGALQTTCPQAFKWAAGGWVGKVVGFAWVHLFLFCSVPKLVYPLIYCPEAASS